MERKGRRFTLPPLARIHAGAHDSTVTVATSACTLKNWQIASVNSTVRELAANWRKGTKSAKSWSTGRQSSVCILVYTALESTAPSLYAATTRTWVIFSSASRCTVQIRGSVLLTSVSTMPGWDRSHCGFSCMYYEHLYSPRMVGEIKEKKTIGTSNKQTVIWPNYLMLSACSSTARWPRSHWLLIYNCTCNVNRYALQQNSDVNSAAFSQLGGWAYPGDTLTFNSGLIHVKYRRWFVLFCSRNCWAACRDVFYRVCEKHWRWR